MQTLLSQMDSNNIGLIGHTIVNYPTPETIRASIEIMVNAGVSCIEIQIPFSEPIADGPVFLKANHDALSMGVTVEDAFELMSEMSSAYDVPFVFMTYANIIFSHGYEAFVKHAVASGAKGLIVPDLPIDLAPELLKHCLAEGLHLISVVPPNASDKRIELLTKQASGFLYAVARAGVTGAKTDFNHELSTLVEKLRAHSSLPIAVGFGVSSREDVERLKPIADYAIVGTAAMRVLQEKGLPGLQAFWQSLSGSDSGK